MRTGRCPAGRPAGWGCGSRERGWGCSWVVLSLFVEGRSVRSSAGEARSVGAEARGVDLAQRDVDGLLVGVEVDRPVAALVTEARGFHAAERGAQVADIVGVEPHHPGLDALREGVGALEVVGPDVGG